MPIYNWYILLKKIYVLIRNDWKSEFQYQGVIVKF